LQGLKRRGKIRFSQAKSGGAYHLSVLPLVPNQERNISIDDGEYMPSEEIAKSAKVVL
jgi:hypothetical protein